MHPFPAHRFVCFRGARGYSMLKHWPSSYTYVWCAYRVTSNFQGKDWLGQGGGLAGRNTPEELNFLKGIDLNSVLEALSPQVVTSVDSSDILMSITGRPRGYVRFLGSGCSKGAGDW